MIVTRVVVDDDQDLARSGLCTLVDSAEDLEVVDGIAATREITTGDDLARVRVLVLITFKLDENVLLALRGASDFRSKGASPAELLPAIRTVAASKALLSPRATQALFSRYLAELEPAGTVSSQELALLTDRERELVGLVTQGLSNDEMTRVIVLTDREDPHHSGNEKAPRPRTAHLVVFAYQNGLTRC